MKLEYMPKLAIITALPAEAKPLRQIWSMRQCTESAKFTIFTDKEQQIYLLQSGSGPVAAALATQALLNYLPNPAAACLLNIGVAGHLDADIGSSWRVDKVTDDASGASYYPGGIIKPKQQLQQCLTRSKYQHDYPKQSLIDMEASGILAASNYFMPREQVEIIKVVSDNLQSSSTENNSLSAKLVSELILSHADLYKKYASMLLDLSASEMHILQCYQVNIKPFTSRWHFSFYQQQQLKSWLRRLQTKHDLAKLHAEAESCCTSATEVFELLSKKHQSVEA